MIRMMALMQPAQRRLDWVLIDPKNGQLPQVGDLVSSDAGGMPVYRVMPLGIFRWKAAG